MTGRRLLWMTISRNAIHLFCRAASDCPLSQTRRTRSNAIKLACSMHLTMSVIPGINFLGVKSYRWTAHVFKSTHSAQIGRGSAARTRSTERRAEVPRAIIRAVLLRCYPQWTLSLSPPLGLERAKPANPTSPEQASLKKSLLPHS
jgi:hypothetical protein